MPSRMIIAVLRKQFPQVTFDEADNTLGVNSFPEWDSLAHFNFMMSLEEAFAVRFSLDEMAELKSIKEIAVALSSRGIVVT